jgi:hypothetical protein
MPATLLLIDIALLALTAIGNPAPGGIGGVELGIGFLLGFAFLFSGVYGVRLGPLEVDREQKATLVVIGLYLLSFVLSFLVAMTTGVEFVPAFRSILPYTAFLPYALAGLLFSTSSAVTQTKRALVLAGLGHAVYLLWLYFVGTKDPLDVRAVLLSRTTFLDARTTLPLFFASAVLPLASIAAERSLWRRALLAFVVFISAAAGFSTQTRSQVLAMGAGMVFFAITFAFWRSRMRAEALVFAVRRLVIVLAVGVAISGTLIATVPRLRVLASTIVARQELSLDNGRVNDEWIPAINAVLRQGVPGILFGVGPGRSFVTLGGEERTYVHNLTIYSLLYNGVIGVFVILSFYLFIVIWLVRKAFVSRNVDYLAFAAMVVAMFFYVQLFAVHKLLSYNLMLAFAVQVALHRERERVPEPVRVAERNDLPAGAPLVA